MSKTKIIKIFGWCLVFNLSYFTAVTAEDLPADSWLLPFEVNQRYISGPPPSSVSQDDVYEFAWQSFIALNWPYLQGGNRGEPDVGGSLAPIRNDLLPFGPVVWETYLKPRQVFVSPRGWNVQWGVPEEGTGPGDFKLLIGPDYTDEFAPGINQPYTHAGVPTGPVTSQDLDYLLYEVTLGQSYFTYIKQFKYYNADRQKFAVKNFMRFIKRYSEAPLPVNNPYQKPIYFQPVPMGREFYLNDLPLYAQQGLVEVKASWKILKTSGENADVPGRYFRRLAQFKLPDGTLSEPKLIGLTGLHIHRVTPPFPDPDAPDQRPLPNHLPSTFEHVDNVEVSNIDCGVPTPEPSRPTLNPGIGSSAPPPYLNGYEVNGVSGAGGIIPAAITSGETLPPKNERPVVNVSRVTPIPDAVQQVNEKYQTMLKGSVWCYYQLVGTQNKNLEEQNPHLGPGLAGPQTSSVQNLINTTLESYTQKGFSCARCHLNAFPQGVDAFPPYDQKYIELHVMSFLLQNAKSKYRHYWLDSLYSYLGRYR